MAERDTMVIHHGRRGTPVNGRIEVNGRIAGTDKGYKNFHVGENETEIIEFRGTITAFIFEGDGSVSIDGQNFRAKNVVGYDTRDGETNDGDGNSLPTNGPATEPEDHDPPTNEGESSDEPASWKSVAGSITNTRPVYGIVNRPITTIDHCDVWVGHGEFGTGLGTRDEPSGTVQDALNARPSGVRHKYHIYLTPGVHDEEPGDSLNTGYGIVDALRSASVKIIGDRDNPRDYVLDVTQMNWQLLAPCLDVQIEGVHLKGTTQMNGAGSALTFDGCVLTPPDSRWGKGDAVAVDFYGGSVMVLDSHIKGDGPAFNLTENGQVFFGGDSSVDVNGPLCTTGIGGGTVVPKGGTRIAADGITEGWEPAPVVIRDTHGVTDHLDTGGNAIRSG